MLEGYNIKTRILFLILMICFFPVVYVCAISEDVSHLVAEDVLSRMEPDFYFFKEKGQNVEKLLKDCDFQEADLNDDGKPEIIVKVNWRSEGNDGFFKGYNFVCGAQDQGNYFIYSVLNAKPKYIGCIEGGSWEALSVTSNGFKDITTYHHMGYDEQIVSIYKYNGYEYKLASQVTEKGSK